MVLKRLVHRSLFALEIDCLLVLCVRPDLYGGRVLG